MTTRLFPALVHDRPGDYGRDSLSIEVYDCDDIDPLVTRYRAALTAAKRSHQYNEDSWLFSCPKSPKSVDNPLARDKCTCGADEHNAAIDAALS